MPVTEVQWIGSSCGRHSSYIFYRGFRLIVDGTVKNYCLGEFYFVRNSANQPICIAELQLVWYDSSTDSQLASARLYFRPEDTPVGRLACHGQDELVYADQKVVFKCQDMAVWQDAGDDWASGLIPLCESDFDCIDSKYYLKRNHAAQEQQAKQEAKETWLKKEHPRMLHILTFPAYCRYRALRKRLLGGACFTRTQIIALGGFIAEHKNTRVVFCRDSFHHPYLDKFELSGETKAPVLKGRPRKKKRLRGVQNSVLTKKRFVADIQNHLVSPAVKRSKFSEEEESTESDRSEDVLDKIKSFPQVVNSIQSSGPPPLIKPKIQVKSLERTNIVEVKKIIGKDVSQLRGERQKIPPPLIPSNQVKGNGLILSQQRSSCEQENVLAVSCSRTTPKLRQFNSSETQIKEAPKATDDTAVLTSESALVERIQASVAMVPVISSITAADGRSGKMFNSSVQNSTTSNPQRMQSMTTVVNTQTAEPLRSVSSSHTNVRLSTTLNTRPVASTQAVVYTSSVTSTRPVVCAQPVPKKLPVTDVRPIISNIKLEVPLQSITTLTSVRPVTSSQSMSFGEAVTSSSADVKQSVTSGADVAAKSKLSKEGEIRQLRPRSASEKRDENEAVDVNVEPIIWKKKKRLRMPGNIKDEEYEDEDEKYFMQTLRDFMKSRNTPLGKIPALGFKKVNLWTMYTTAQRYGGYDAVTSKRMWRRVYDSLGGSTTITSAATYTRRHYERLLLPYERFIRSQLKDKVDKKLPITPPSHGVSAQKDTAALPAKQVTSQPLTISNCKPEPGVQLERKVSASVKSSQGDSQTNQSRNQESENRTVPPRHATQPEMNRTVDSKVALVERQQWDAANKSITGHVARPVASPMETKVSCKSELSSITTRPFNRQSQESQSHSTTDSCQASRTATSTPITSTADARVQVVTSQQNLNYRYVKLVRQDEETSARTSAVYAKNPMADTYHANLPKEAASLQRVARKQHSDNLPTQTMDEFGIGREIIDLTLDDSLPVQKNHPSSLVRSSLESLREKSEVSGLSGLRGTDSRRDASHLQIHGEYIHDNTSRHHSLGETQPSVDMASVHGIKSYNSRHSGSPKMTLQLQEGARAQTVHKSRDKMYSNVKQESSHHKQDKVRNPQAHVESMHGRMTHSPSQESVDEHFAEWHRRQSGVQQQHSRHSVAHPRQAAEHELGQLRYTYVNEDICAQDCACSVPKKRKDNTILSPPLRMKKEHYEDDLPFTGMAVYPGRWTPPVVADHPDLYISSYTDAPHMQGSPDSLASHMCTASRIFLPQAQIFNPPYHMGMAPMAAPPLLAGSDDRLHIHPHCLISSPYPCTSNSRAPETGGYPLYSFT